MAKRGARLMLAARREDEVRRAAESLGAGASWSTLEARDVGAVRDLFARVSEEMGPIRGAVNLAGSILLKPAHLTTAEEWEETVGLNLTTAFAVVRAGALTMRDGGGSIVLVSSAAARVGLSNHEAIAAAKAGVIGLSQSAAATYAPRLRVNVVAPGLVRSAMSERITSSESALKASEAMHPMGRIGEPEEVARAIEWLLDPEQSWVTGETLSVDGGLAGARSR